MEDFPRMVGDAKWGKIIVDYICFKMIKMELPFVGLFQQRQADGHQFKKPRN
jgi:hypothetical protein